MWLSVIFFILGLLLIIKGADWFTDASLSLAKKLNIPTIVIGATLVSVATTMPEFFTSLIATIRGHTQIAIGNVLGSCICNIGLILGLVWLCSTYVPNHDRTVQVKSFLLIGMTLSVWLLSFGFGYTTRWLSLLLLGFTILFLNYNRQLTVTHRRTTVPIAFPEFSLPRTLLFFFLGLAALLTGSDLLVRNGVTLAHTLGISELAIGISLVAIGTSLPELATAIASIIKHHPELSVGNLLGADVLNLGLIIGVCGLVSPLPLSYITRVLSLPLLLILTLIVFSPRGNIRLRGISLLCIYIAYLILHLWYG